MDKASDKSESIKDKSVPVDAESVSEPAKLSYAEVVAKPAFFGSLDFRHFHADGTLRNEPLLDEPKSTVYGSDAIFIIFVTQRLGISKVDKIIGVLPKIMG